MENDYLVIKYAQMEKLRTTPRKDFGRHMSTAVLVNTCGIQILSFGVSEFSEYIASYLLILSP